MGGDPVLALGCVDALPTAACAMIDVLVEECRLNQDVPPQPCEVECPFVKTYIHNPFAWQSRAVTFDATGAGHAGPGFSRRLVGRMH